MCVWVVVVCGSGVVCVDSIVCGCGCGCGVVCVVKCIYVFV